MEGAGSFCSVDLGLCNEWTATSVTRYRSTLARPHGLRLASSTHRDMRRSLLSSIACRPLNIYISSIVLTILTSFTDNNVHNLN